MKKVLAFILSLAMLLSMSVTAFADGVGTTVITDANSTEEAVQSWKQYYSGTGQMQMEPTFKAMLSLSDVASMEKYGDLDHQQFGVVKFSSGSGYKVRFSTSSTENITGYVGEYGSKQMPAWVPLAFSYNTQNMHATGGVSTVISSGDPVTLDLSFPETYGQGQNGAVYIGFALAEAPKTDVSVTVTLLKKTHDNEPDEEIGSAVLNFTAASQQSEQTDTVAPTAVTIGGTFSDIIGDKTYRLHLNAGEQNEYRTAMNLIAALTPANATGEIVWSSADANIVTVSALQNNSYGATVTAVGAGKTTVTATIKGTNISDIITVKVFGKTAATVGDKKYETLADALEDAEDGSAITVDTAMTIGNVPVAAGSIVTATNSTETAVTSSAATVTPKTLTITNGTGESATKQTAKAYVVSSSGDSAKSAVVTDVKFAGNSNITKGAGASVENYVNVAQVLANAVAANATGDSPIDVSSISSMTLRLDKTDDTASTGLTKDTVASGEPETAKNQLIDKLNNSNITVYDVKPIATVTTATTTGTTTSTKTYEYDASKEVTGEFKFKLHVSSDSTDVGKTANLTHYHDDNGTWTATPITGIVDNNGDVTVTLNQFSYISVDGVDYEVCGTITDMTLVVGSDNKLVYTFALNDAGKALSNPQVKLNLDGVGYLNSVSESEFNASRDTVYTVSENSGVYTLTIKVFAMYMNAKVYVELWDGASQKAIESYSRSKFDVSGYESYKTAQTGLTFGYSLVEYLGYYAGATKNSNYTALYNAMIPYAEAAAAFRQN